MQTDINYDFSQLAILQFRDGKLYIWHLLSYQKIVSVLVSEMLITAHKCY